MAESTTAADSNSDRAPHAVALLCIVIVGAISVPVLMNLRSFRTWEARESAVENTAVGDKNYFKPPQPSPNPPSAVGNLGGKPAAPVDYKPIEIRDTHMRKADRMEGSDQQVYMSIDDNDRSLYVKTGPNEYLKLDRKAAK